MGSILADMTRAMPYAVPNGYFSTDETERRKAGWLAGSEEQWFGVAHHGNGDAEGFSLGKAMPHSVPEGYFDALAGNIMSAVNAEHLSVSSKAMPYSVPAGYFEALPGQVLHAARAAEPEHKKAKQIPLKPNRFTQIRWTAAAVLLICIGFGTYQTVFNQAASPEIMLATVPDNEIQDYLQHTYILDVNRVMDGGAVTNIEVENKDIIQYLNETGWDLTE